MEIRLRTLTPLWTGGVDGRCDRVHETGIIGSLRWWYEALVRGLGGYACDPASDEKDARCLFNAKSYGRVLERTGDCEAAVNAGLEKSVCPVCYLFGCTGWRRLFRLEVSSLPDVPLHLRTTLLPNASWFDLMFGGKDKQFTVDSHRVFYSPDELPAIRLRLRGYDIDYAHSQLALMLRFADAYAGLGAKLQHGFGQVALILPTELESTSLEKGLRQLKKALDARPFRNSGPAVPLPNLEQFFFLDYGLPESALRPFIRVRYTRGSDNMSDREPAYVPVAFDLRTKGSVSGRTVGLRRWLEWDAAANRPRWSHDLVCQVMGASKKGGGDLPDEERQSTRVFVSMPYRDGQAYRLRWFGLAPPGQKLPDGKPLTVKVLTGEIQAYMRQLFDGVEPDHVVTGRKLLEEVGL